MPSLTKIQTGFLEPQGAFELDPGTAGSPGLFFSGNTSTGMFSPSAGVLGFSTGSTQQALTILADGKVGIGTTQPLSLLNPHGTASLTNVQQTVLVSDSNSDDSLGRGGNIGFGAYVNGAMRTIAAIGGLKTNAGNSFNGDLALYTRVNGQANLDERLRITYIGYVGIGTTQPSSRLTSVDNIEARDTSGWRGIKIENTGSPQSIIKSINYLGAGYESQLRFQTMTGTTTTDAMSIVGSGNIGVGTTDPQTKIHLYNTVSGAIVETLRLQNGSDGLNAGTEIVFSSNNVAHVKLQQLVTGATAGDRGSDFLIFTKADNGSIGERLRITSDGNVGIGTDNPDAKLKVDIASGNDGIVVQNTSTANVALIGARNGDATIQIGQWGSTASGTTFGLSNANLAFVYTATYSSTHPSALALGTFSNTPIVFATNNNETLRINSSGNVGIGTATINTDEKLHIQGNVRISSLNQLRLNSFGRIGAEAQQIGNMLYSGLYGANITYLAKYDSGWKTTGGGTASAITIDEGRFTFANSQYAAAPDTNITWTDRLSIDTAGNVGIGTTDPQSKLDVRGNVKINGSSAYPQALQVSGYNDLTGTSVNTNPSTTHSGGGGIRLVNNDNTPNYGVGIYFDHGSLSSAILSSRIATNNWGTDLRFYTHPVNTTDQFLTFERMRIRADGNVGIGTTDPSLGKLDVRRSSNSLFPDIASFANTDTSSETRAFIRLSSSYIDDYEGSIRIGAERETTTNRSSIIFYTADTASSASEKMRIRASGNVGIGSTNPQYNLDVTGNFRVSNNIINRSYTFTDTIYNSAAQRKIVCRVNGTYAGSCVRVTVSGTTGNVVVNGWWDIIVNHSQDIGIVSYGGNYTPVYLRVTSGGDDSYDIDLYRTGNTASNDTGVRITVTCFGMETVTPTNTGTYNGPQLEASAFSGMRIWGNNDGSAGGDPGDLTVNGNLSKGSGTFKIDHPLPSKKDTHYLVHSFTESPQADLIYRGTVELQNGTAQINIDESAGMTEGTFVVLCRNVQCYTTNESGWDLVKGSVSGNILTIESQNTSSTDTISWMVIGERQDPHIYRSSATGTDGRIIIEPSKDLP